MELRSDPRIEANQPVIVSVIGEAEARCSGRVTTVCGGGMGVMVDRAIPMGEAIQVTLPGNLLLGEVRHCRAEGDGFQMGLELIQRLTIEDLKTLSQTLGR